MACPSPSHGLQRSVTGPLLAAGCCWGPCPAPPAHAASRGSAPAAASENVARRVAPPTYHGACLAGRPAALPAREGDAVWVGTWAAIGGVPPECPLLRE